MLWYTAKITLNSISVGLILKIFQGKPLNPTYQQNSQGKVYRLPRYVSYIQGPHVYDLPRAPWILSADLLTPLWFFPLCICLFGNAYKKGMTTFNICKNTWNGSPVTWKNSWNHHTLVTPGGKQIVSRWANLSTRQVCQCIKVKPIH